MFKAITTATIAVALASSGASAGVLDLDLGTESVGVVGGVGPSTGTLTFDPTNDNSNTRTRLLRLFNTIDSQTNVTSADNSIDGSVDSFARVGGASAGDPGDDDGIDGELNLTFDDGFTYGRNATIVFDEFGSEDEPFSVAIEIGGMLFEISTDVANMVDGVTETEVSDNGKTHRIYELDLSGSYFDALTGSSFNSFSILDDTATTNLSPDITFAGVVVPVPGAAGLAGLGLVGGALRRRR